MKRFLKRFIFLAAVVIASGCATTAQNGSNATAANLIQSAEIAWTVGSGLYDAGKLTDDEATAIATAIRSAIGFVNASQAAAKAGDKASEATYLRAAADVLDAITAQLAAKKGN